MSAPRYDEFNDVYVYAFGDGRFVDIPGREVRDRGWAEVTRMLGLKYEPSTERLPVKQYGRVVGTLPADFDLMLVRSKSFLYDPRPGDFKREGDVWIAADSLGSGDFECIPEFRRADEELLNRLDAIAEHDWRVSLLAHTSDTAAEAAARIRAWLNDINRKPTPEGK